MNNVILSGRLTKDPEVRYSASQVAYGNYTLAVDRPFKKDAENTADFIYCKVLGKTAEFAERYLQKGTKVIVSGRIQVDNFKDKDGNNRSTTYALVQTHEFCESRGNSQAHPSNVNDQSPLPKSSAGDGFMNIPDNVDDELLPFN